MTPLELRYLWAALCAPVLALALLGACSDSAPRFSPSPAPLQWLGDPRCKGKPLDVQRCEQPGYEQHVTKQRKAAKRDALGTPP